MAPQAQDESEAGQVDTAAKRGSDAARLVGQGPSPGAASEPPEFLVRSAAPLNGGPAPAAQAASFLTPNDIFFVRNHGAVPGLSPATHRIAVTGLVDSRLGLSLADLEREFERVEICATLACAGQRRNEMTAVAPIPGELPWGGEAVSTALWSGWRLGDVLAAAGVMPTAAHVGFTGADLTERRGRSFGYGASIPLAKALSPEVVLADRMNGEPLPAAHGYPLRAVVPGYIGARQVKWLTDIELRSEPSDNYFQAVAYRLYPTWMNADTMDASLGVELTELEVNSLICQPEDGAVVGAGPVTVRGIAYSGGERTVERVELSVDGGRSWTAAQIVEPPLGAQNARFAWRIFVGEVTPRAGPDGRGEVLARARDSAGASQPESPAAGWNFKGYMNNAWSRVRVRLR